MSPIKAGAAVLAAAFVLQIAFAVSYVGALHKPTPHAVPVAVVASGESAAKLNALPGHPLAARVVPTRAAALTLVEDRSVYGIVEGTRLDVASAANKATATALETVLKGFSVHDLKPLPKADPNGIAPFYAVIAWVFGGYLGATLLGLVAGRRSRNPWLRLAGMAAYSVAAALVSLLALRAGFGVLSGPLLALVGVAALTIFASGAATLGLQSLLGMAGTGLVILLFVILGNAASGGPYARDLLPGLWSTVGGLLPPGAGVDLVRNVVYFGGAQVLGGLAVLAAWALGGTILTLGARDRARA